VRDSISLEAYIRTRVEIHNDLGGRGYDEGIRTFNCPRCGDRKHRGWLNILRWTSGCWNLGCVAEPRLSGGAIEWVRLHEGLETRGKAWVFLIREFPAQLGEWIPEPKAEPIQDWCLFPENFRWVTGETRRMEEYTFLNFARQQWGLKSEDAVRWNFGFALSGRYRMRLIIPIVLDSHPVAWQARAIARGVEPKYLTSTNGKFGQPGAECGRPAAALLFNLDGVPPGSDVMLVEGAGDVMGWLRGCEFRAPAPVGLLGTALTPEKLGLIAGKRPRRVIVALDAEPAAQRRALSHVEDLEAWGLSACRGTWRGGKDAGSGATLATQDFGPLAVGDHLRARLQSSS